MLIVNLFIRSVTVAIQILRQSGSWYNSLRSEIKLLFPIAMWIALTARADLDGAGTDVDIEFTQLHRTLEMLTFHPLASP